MINKLFLFLITYLLLFVGCSLKEEKIFKANNGLPFHAKQNNIAALFTMTDESGRKENLKMMEDVFSDGTLGFKFETHHNKPSKYIYERLSELSKEVGQFGTLLIYLNSHGGGSGSRFGMTSSDGSFKFSKALDAIAKENKVQRLIVLIDTCHASGGIQEAFEGKEKLIENIKTHLPELPSYYEEKILKTKDNSSLFSFRRVGLAKVKMDYGASSNAYKECLIIASSSADDLSTRGAFASRLKSAFEKAKKEEKEITVGGFLKIFAGLHNNTTQKPHYKIIPTDFMLNEPLFGNALIREIPIIDRQNPDEQVPIDFIPVPQ